MKNFPHYKQPDAKDCGPVCLQIIAKFYGQDAALETLRNTVETTREGSNLLHLGFAAKQLGFDTTPVKIETESLCNSTLPCILHWNQNHFIVLYKIKNGKYYVSDPAIGKIIYDSADFERGWKGVNSETSSKEGIALLLQPNNKFKKTATKRTALNKEFLLRYVKPYKGLFIQLLLSLLIVSIIQLLLPLLTQRLVDDGIKNKDFNIVYLILAAQLVLFIAKSATELIRGWLLLHLSTRINLTLLSDFLIKMMNLPISFFDIKLSGDILQRIGDHHRIESFLTHSTLNSLFSIVSLLVLGTILAYYNLLIFAVFAVGSILYFTWILLLLSRRAVLDHRRFAEVTREQNAVIEMINGMQDIKLHNAEIQKRWGWESIQVALFKTSASSLVLEQVQSAGSNFINELKNIGILFLAAKLVIDGEITLGMMMAIVALTGSLNAPIVQLIQFIRDFQDAKISLVRLAEINDREDEHQSTIAQVDHIPRDADIEICNLTFRYPSSTEPVLKNLSFTIPSNKTTAIVGTSGSGKSTLFKILLKFYKPGTGEINIGSVNLDAIAQSTWRGHVGSVMQDGHIFNDTIAGNIAIGSEIKLEQLRFSAATANILSYIDSLPRGFDTMIGGDGMGMSSGQRQRLLIARAVYKNPEILFFDEATSVLDANNEKEIMYNLTEFLRNKTAIIIAHRLSTIIHADQIVVLENGQIIEKGNHSELVNLNGKYMELIKNQLSKAS